MTTGRGALLERCDFLGIESEAEYVEIAQARIASVDASSYALQAQDPPPKKKPRLGMDRDCPSPGTTVPRETND